MSEAVGIKTIRNRVDYYLKNGATEVSEEYYASARLIMNLGLSFNRNIDTKQSKYDECYEDYPKIEAQLAKTIAKLREAYKGKNMAVETLDAKGKPIVIEMDSKTFFDYAVENLEYSLKERGIKFNKSLFQPKNDEKEM